MRKILFLSGLFFFSVPVSGLLLDVLDISHLAAALAGILVILIIFGLFYRKILLMDRIFIKIFSIRCLKEFIFVVLLLYGMIIALFATFYYCIDLYHHAGSSYFKWLYFSVVTVTTVGYGDVIPINGLMKFLVSLECLIGYISLPVIFTVGLGLILRENKV